MNSNKSPQGKKGEGICTEEATLRDFSPRVSPDGEKRDIKAIQKKKSGSLARTENIEG